MEEYIQKQLWSEEDYTRQRPSTVRKMDAASIWLAELGTASQVKELIAMADSCKIRPSREQATYWYTLRYVLTLQKKGLEAEVEIEQDSPYEKIRIMSIWMNAENLT